MHETHSLALLAALSTAVLSTPVHNRRQAQVSAPFVLRTDKLCGLRNDQKFYDYLVSTVVNPNAPGGFSITFVKNTPEDLPRAAQAVADDQGVISFSIPAEIGTPPLVRYLNLGSQQPPSGPQPYSLGEKPENPARLYLGGDPYLGVATEEVIKDQQLRLKGESVTPEWSTWAVCPGLELPELVWLGVIGSNVVVPTDCEPLRLVAADPTDPSKTPRGCPGRG
ncbi:MAG: hypothetical protein LQ345_004542 [Seirophora villosa]|nr:MAG: hypothetical protein LQ345_004542 [Seirophora villosa]